MKTLAENDRGGVVGNGKKFIEAKGYIGLKLLGSDRYIKNGSSEKNDKLKLTFSYLYDKLHLAKRSIIVPRR